MHVDLDEIHEYPARLPQVLADAEHHSISFITGELLDRLPDDGGLSDVDPTELFAAALPLGCRVMAAVAKADVRKLMVWRAGLPVACCAWQRVDAALPAAWRQRGVGPYRVHHFKCVASAPPRPPPGRLSTRRPRP
jgi:hypothetical protein